MATPAHKPTTPITAQLERLLSGTSADSNAAKGTANAGTTSAGTSSPARSIHASPRQSLTSLGSSASTAGLVPPGSDAAADPLENLFGFQFDNLQHILRYVLGELRAQKRVGMELAQVSQRVAAVESGGEATAALQQQAGVCRKHNTHVSLLLARMEERITKENALTNRRLGGLEVITDKLDQTLAAHATQIDKLTEVVNAATAAQAARDKVQAQQQLSRRDSDRAPPADTRPALVSLPSLSLQPSSSASRRDTLELEGMSSQISKFMAQQTHAQALLVDRVNALEDAASTAQRIARDWETKVAFLSNENKRMSEKLARMEDAWDQSKMQPPPQALMANTPAAAVRAAPTTAAPVAAAPTAAVAAPSVRFVEGAAPVAVAPAAAATAAGLPAAAAPPAEVTIAVDTAHIARVVEHQLVEAQRPATVAAPVRLSEADLAGLHARVKADVAEQVSSLRAELDAQWAVEKEMQRDHKRLVLDSVQQSVEAAAEARSAVTQAKRVVDGAARAAERSANATLLSQVSGLDGPNIGPASDAPVGFAGLEQLHASSSSRAATPSINMARPPPTNAAALPPSCRTAGQKPPLNATQQEFDRVRAMAELALRRTVQHAEALAAASNASGAVPGSDSSVPSLLDVDKLRSSFSALSSRLLFTEDKLETLNALTLATRNQLQSLSSSMDNNPLIKSISLRVFEAEVKQAEVRDQVQLLAHLLSKGSFGASAQSTGALLSNPQQAQADGSAGKAKAAAGPPLGRSLVSALALDEKQAAQKGGKNAQQRGDSDSDDEDSAKAPAAAVPAARSQPAQTAATGVAGSATASSAESAGFTDAVNTNVVSLGMVMRGAAASPPGTAGSAGADATAASDRMAKDLAVLGSLQEKLASAAALDAKLAQVEALEAKVASLLDLDMSERMTFLERRFTTELTFLRAHVNSKVDSSALKILLEKVEMEGQFSAAAAAAAAQQASQTAHHAPHSSASPSRPRGRSNSVMLSAGSTDLASSSGGGHAAASSSIDEDGAPLSPSGGGLMSRTTSRDHKSRVSSELEARARERKQRSAHLLAMLEKKADVASIRQLEEFVRSIDRHLRSMIQTQANHIRHLEHSGSGRTQSTKTTVAGYDEPEAAAPSAPARAAAAARAAIRGDYDDEDPDDVDDAQLAGGDDDHSPTRGGRRRPLTLIHGRKSPLRDRHEASIGPEVDEDEAAARIGFKLGSSGSEVRALHDRCEELQHQIASMHALLARKTDRPAPSDAIHASGTATATGDAVSAPAGVIGVPVTLDGLTLNPHLSLLTHPHHERLLTRVSEAESQLQHVQGLVMYQTKQLHNHREWIAKHSREIGALREFIAHGQGNQALNAAAVGGATGASGAVVPAGSQPSGSQTARDASSLSAASSYPSPAVFQLLRQVEADLLSLRRSLRQKVDFADLGLTAPGQASHSSHSSEKTNYPHPTLEDLRRLLFYLTPQLQSGQLGAGGSLGQEGKSLFSTKGLTMPPIPGAAADSGVHTHGQPGGDWKCVACARALDSVQMHPSSRGSARHTGMPVSLSSLAPAGGLVGANTRRLIASTTSSALFHSPGTGGAGAAQTGAHAITMLPSSGANLTPRPPTGTQTQVGASARKGAAQPSTASAVPSAPTDSGKNVDFTPAVAAASQAADSAAAAEKAARKAEKRRMKAEAKHRDAAQSSSVDAKSSTQAHASSVSSASIAAPASSIAVPSASPAVPSVESGAAAPAVVRTPSVNSASFIDVVAQAEQQKKQLQQQQQRESQADSASAGDTLPARIISEPEEKSADSPAPAASAAQ